MLLNGPHTRTLLLPALLALGACLGASAATEPAAATLLCGGRLQVSIPTGWQLTQAGEAGGVLRPEDGLAPPIEVVGWDVPRGGEPSADAAAAAEETLLFRTAPYARTASRPYKTASGAEGLLVTGQVRGAGDKLQQAVFAAFVSGGRYYIVGTLTTPGAEAPAGLFSQVLQSLQFVAAPGATPAPAVLPAPAATAPAAPAPAPTAAATPPAPAPPVATVVPAAPTAQAAPTAPQTIAMPPPVAPPLSVNRPEGQPLVTAPERPAPGAPATPSTPAVLPPAVMEGARPQPNLPLPDKPVPYTSPLGFRVEYPAGWHVALVGGHLEITSPPGDGSDRPGAMAVIWPLTGLAEGEDPARLAREYLAHSEFAASGTEGLVARPEHDGVVLAGTVGVGGAQRRLLALCEVQGDNALLTALLARPEDFSREAPVLARILGSFSGGPWWTGDGKAPDDGWTTWRDPALGVLQLPVPTGWKTRGGVQSYNGVCSLFVELTSSDDRGLCVTWQQPAVPLFRELTPVLRNLGWQEGDKYITNPGDQPLRILSRLAPQDFLTRYWLQSERERLEGAVLDEVHPAPAAAGLVEGENPAALAATLHGTGDQGPRQRLTVIATADAPTRIGPNCWQAAVLQVEAPAGATGEALAVLHRAVSGAEVVVGSARSTPAGLPQMLRAAREALTVLPAAQAAGLPGQEVLAALNPKGKGHLWLQPASALEPWQHVTRRLQQSGDAAEILPELRPGFWK